MLIINYLTKCRPSFSWLKLAAIAVLFFCSGRAFCQDVIYTTAGAEIKCKVQEIGEDSVSFKDPSAQLSSPPKFMLKKEVAKIKYANGYEDTFNKMLAVPAATDKKTTPASVTAAATGDVIFTVDGKQLACKVTAIDDNIISYLPTGTTTTQQIDSKEISYIKYSNGTEEAYNRQPNQKTLVADTKAVKKTNEVVDEKKTLSLVLQNWRRKYVAPALELF